MADKAKFHVPIPFDTFVAETDAFLSTLDSTQFRWEVLKYIPNTSAMWRLRKLIHWEDKRFPHSPLRSNFFAPSIGELSIRTRPNGSSFLELSDVPMPSDSDATKFALYRHRYEMASEWVLIFSEMEQRERDSELEGKPITLFALSELRGINELQGEAQDKKIQELIAVTSLYKEDLKVFLKSERDGLMLAYNGWLHAQFDTNGVSVASDQPEPMAPQEGKSPVTAGPSARTGVFINHSDHWEIGFVSEPFHYSNQIGLRYLAYLLQKPDESLACIRLVELVRQKEATSEKWSDASLAEAGLSASNHSDEGDDLMDHQYKQQILEDLEEFDNEIRNATASGQYERALQAEQRRDDLLKHFQAATGLGGKPRKFADENARARGAVLKAIQRGISRIRRKNKEMAAYLEQTVETGSYCSYRPAKAEKPITFVFK